MNSFRGILQTIGYNCSTIAFEGAVNRFRNKNTGSLSLTVSEVASMVRSDLQRARKAKTDLIDQNGEKVTLRSTAKHDAAAVSPDLAKAIFALRPVRRVSMMEGGMYSKRMRSELTNAMRIDEDGEVEEDDAEVNESQHLIQR